ncbi:glycosyltransferase family 2 protein [Allosphingosinicella deserti]|nr:glycosyltransferase family 2 protein [Sphingomonas deserti]
MFSVVIPLYNKREFILATVRSVIAQTFADFELIVVDDGSTDGGLALLEDLDDPRLRLISQRNCGKGVARNRGMQESRRPWIAFLDADDLWFPDHLSELARMAALHPEAGLLATAYGEGTDPTTIVPGGESRVRPIAYFREAASKIGVVWSSATAVRRDVAREVGDFGPWRTGEDLEYWARVALIAPVVKSDRVTAYYLRNESSEMAQVYREQARNAQPQTLSVAWPSVAYLQSVRLKLDRTQRRDVDAYIRMAAYLSSLGRMVAGDIDGARSMARQMPGHRLDRAALVSLALRIPEPAIRLALTARQALRRSRG